MSKEAKTEREKRHVHSIIKKAYKYMGHESAVHLADGSKLFGKILVKDYDAEKGSGTIIVVSDGQRKSVDVLDVSDLTREQIQ